MAIGIVCEYNPFHNGHKYHIEKIKELYKNEEIILVLSGHFLQRGTPSIIDKWKKTEIALYMGVDLVVELPFPFASQSADIFAKGAIELLVVLKVDKLIFGSESNDIDSLQEMAKVSVENNEYQHIIKTYLKEGNNYPSALAKGIHFITGKTINTPNDLLGLSYIREIYKQHSSIVPITIKRTNCYHDKNIKSKISSATSIRLALKQKDKVEDVVPLFVHPYLSKNLVFDGDYFSYIKYIILTQREKIRQYQTVDEGIESRLVHKILQATTQEEFIHLIKTKRYTYNKINRMLTHILCHFTKEEAKLYQHIEYIRVLGFNEKGQKYLNQYKKEFTLPLITKYKKNIKMLELEARITCIYASIFNEEEKKALIEKEYKSFPIRF